jgi:DNA-binding transcriptional LysR family regulator
MSIQRTRTLSLGPLRAFEATARLLNFSAAAEELSLTQSAISRQIQSLENELGQRLFIRHARTVELTQHGLQLRQVVSQSLLQIDNTVQNIRATSARRSIAVTTFASFASMWLIPRLAAFQTSYPDIDIRIHANDKPVELATSDIDIAIRYGPANTMPANAQKLFGEQLMPVASPLLLQREAPIAQPADLASFALIEQNLETTTYMDWMNWRLWLNGHGLHRLQPKRWLYFNYTYQSVQAAIDGLGLVLARPPLIAANLARGDLVEVLPGHRNESPMGYWLLTSPMSTGCEEVQVFSTWLQHQASDTASQVPP